MAGTILHVDLTSGKVWKESISVEDARKYIGSRGLNARLLWDLTRPGIDPLGPENPLIFGPGRLNGTNAPSAGRTTITCKSPATGLYLKTNVGGHWGTELKFAGYDHLVVHGASETPVYLYITNEKVEIRDASELWGKDVRQTTELLRKKLAKKLEVACIGQAGENLVNMASIMCSIYNAAARGGPGAVMGSKKLKAVAVSGDGHISFADPEAFNEAAMQCVKGLYKESGIAGLHAYGTSGTVLPLNELKGLPVDNFKRGFYEEAEKIGGIELAEAGYLKRKVGCNGCIIGCHRYSEVEKGPYKGSFAGGPEYETVNAVGGGCGIWNLEPILKANELCNIYGMDTISVGGVIQWAMECYEKGVLTKEDTGGMELTFGNEEAMVKLVEQIAFREGLGDLLSMGVKKAAEKAGKDSYKWAVEIKGLEQSRVDTRSAFSYALAFAVNPRGADHLHTECFAEFGLSQECRDVIKKITGDEKYANPYLPEKRADIVRWHEDCYAVTDSLGFCAFVTTALYGVTPELMARLFGATLGTHVTEEEIMETGRRIVTLEKAFNVREGADRKLDTAPWRLMNEALVDRAEGNNVITREILDKMLDEYYDLHGWDRKTSWPREETLAKLGLDQVVQGLREVNRLPE
ncbi:MAG: aldehyde ferredoxin oxidoreductase family protein [Clostridia bacterium]|uniref:aldehyde ferredoxin oxidoreductase family protein n=1 Tax=Desulfitibacter alkalitolerans TaxID=264641 RepID=UPI000555D53E|nr:aldehyde ferredoxin oxidoreductase family protein [Desulfitibacter alkalitolerans]MBS3968607.1 aldehyde ferredoxin oxidoreductase family protein [Clostridia bacterium]